MIAVISLMLVEFVVLQPQVRADASLPPLTLTVVALNGTQVVLHENDVESLTFYRAYGGLRKLSGTLGNLGNYTGVPIATFLNMIGGIGSGYSVSMIAPNYSQTLSYEALNGTGLNTYDNVTGLPVQAKQTLTPIVACYYNDANLSSTNSPLELAIVGPEGLCTDGKLWVSNVVRLEVHPNLQPMNLTIVAANGTTITLNETVISHLPALRAFGGLVNQVGILKNLGNYTGVQLTTLCNLVGGLGSSNSLLITASDNYTAPLSFAQVNGNWTTYDNVTGQPAPQTQLLTPILAYYFNDANLSSTEGPLQLAIVGQEGLLTDGRYWVHSVVSIKIQSTSVPEFSASSLIPFFMIATIMAAPAFRRKFGTCRRDRSSIKSSISGLVLKVTNELRHQSSTHASYIYGVRKC